MSTTEWKVRSLVALVSVFEMFITDERSVRGLLVVIFVVVMWDFAAYVDDEK